MFDSPLPVLCLVCVRQPLAWFKGLVLACALCPASVPLFDSPVLGLRLRACFMFDSPRGWFMPCARRLFLVCTLFKGCALVFDSPLLA